MAIEAHHTAQAKRDGAPLPNPFGLNDIGERMGFGSGWTTPQSVAGAARDAANAAGFRPAGAASGPGFTPAEPPPQPGTATPGWGAPVDAYPPPYTPPAAAPYAAPFTAQDWQSHGPNYAQHSYGPGYPPYSAPVVPPFGTPFVPPGSPIPPPVVPPLAPRNRFPVGAVWLIGLGTVFLLGTEGIFSGIRGEALVGFGIIALGVTVFVRRMTAFGGGMENDGTSDYQFRLLYALRPSVWLLLIGVLFVLDTFDVLHWSHSWPLLIILAGVMMLLGRAPYRAPYPYPEPPAAPVAEAPASGTDMVRLNLRPDETTKPESGNDSGFAYGRLLMASYPPPPAGQPPYGDPRAQRQYIKDMGRAQKAAAREYIRQEKQRRDLYRYQARAMRRSSILGPLIVLAAGIVFLLIGLGRLPLFTFIEWYSRWWPIFLVGAGIILVAEWAFDQSMHNEGQPYVRRGIGGGAVLLLILLAITGPIIRAIHASRDAFGNSFVFNPDNFDELFGDKRDSEQQIDQPFAPGTSLTIDNPHGDVTIVGKSGDNQVHILVNKQIYVRSDSDADDKAQRLSPRVNQFGSILSVSVPTMQGGNADLTVTVPDTGETTVTTNHGTINISGMRAPVNVTTNHGNVELNSNRRRSERAHQQLGQLVRGTQHYGHGCGERPRPGSESVRHQRGCVARRRVLRRHSPGTAAWAGYVPYQPHAALADAARWRPRPQLALGADRQPDRRTCAAAHLEPQHLLRARRGRRRHHEQQGLGRHHERGSARQRYGRKPRWLDPPDGP